MLTRRRLLTSSIVGCAAVPLGLRSSADAQTLQKTARILVGFPPGGSSDYVARLLADKMKGYAQNIIVDNKAGAGGRIALETLKRSDADGSVFILTPGDQLTLFPHVYKLLSYDPLRDFIPVTTVCAVQFVLAVGPLVPAEVRSLADFVQWSRANPKLASFGTAGAGTRLHFIGEALARAAGFEFVHVPYKGGPAAMQDVLSGAIAANVSVLSNAVPHAQAGTVRVLAITAGQRSPALPLVPTMRELGYPTLEGEEIFGILVPDKTPTSAVDGLATVVREALKTDEAKAGLAKLSFDTKILGRNEFAALLASDTARWGAIVKEMGFKPLD